MYNIKMTPNQILTQVSNITHDTTTEKTNGGIPVKITSFNIL